MRRTSLIKFCTEFSAVVVPLATCLAAVPAGPQPAASASQVGKVATSAFTTTAGYLSGVAATSATNAWAVGGAHNGSPLILLWNGTDWARQRVPRLRGSAELSSVAATSARNAWAVGAVSDKTLILHWNGVSWKRTPSPSPSGSPELTSVTAAPGGAALAVGFCHTRNGPLHLILRWTGRIWRMERAVGEGLLVGVGASSAHNAWAVGSGPPGYWTVYQHWNGRRWKRVTGPNYVGGVLYGVSTVRPGDAWAVGVADQSGALIVHWNGSSWRRVRGPDLTGAPWLLSVTAAPGGTVWAVGARFGAGKTLVLRWTGHAWRRVPSPSPSVGGGSDDFLAGVGSYSSGAWAVGFTGGGDSFILNWNGERWS